MQVDGRQGRTTADSHSHGAQRPTPNAQRLQLIVASLGPLRLRLTADSGPLVFHCRWSLLVTGIQLLRGEWKVVPIRFF